jgi:energy-coupling factor transporter ATP-binding protein EcfA2
MPSGWAGTSDSNLADLPSSLSCIERLRSHRDTKRYQTMKLIKYSYSELMNTERFWRVEPVSLESVCLFVGKNASGKSRLLRSINGLAIALSGRFQKIFTSGHWTASFLHDDKLYDYELKIDNKIIVSESLVIDGTELIRRDEEGRGQMLAQEIGRSASFKLPVDKLAAGRMDEVQFGYLSSLQAWAEKLQKYSFGSEFGRNILFGAPMQDIDEQEGSVSEGLIEPDHVVKLYVRGYRQFGESFDNQILSDLNSIGYDCERIDAVHFNREIMFGNSPAITHGTFPVALQLHERGVEAPVSQIEMSNGMFRALALIINLNYLVMSGDQRCVLVDDIGEGLDFDRSTKLIHLLIEKCRGSGSQLLMTTNDRFVMNETPLEYWHIVHRTGHVVSILDYQNSRDMFDEFSDLGLSNFDFFARDIYLSDEP